MCKRKKNPPFLSCSWKSKRRRALPSLFIRCTPSSSINSNRFDFFPLKFPASQSPPYPANLWRLLRRLTIQNLTRQQHFFSAGVPIFSPRSSRYSPPDIRFPAIPRRRRCARLLACAPRFLLVEGWASCCCCFWICSDKVSDSVCEIRFPIAESGRALKFVRVSVVRAWLVSCEICSLIRWFRCFDLALLSSLLLELLLVVQWWINWIRAFWTARG